MKHPKVTFYKDRAIGWRWRLQAPNARIVCDSSEGYSSLAKARKGFGAVVKYAPRALWIEL